MSTAACSKLNEVSSLMILEGVHFLGNNIRFLPNRSRKQIRLLKNRQTNFGEAEGAEHLARGLLDAVPQRGLRRENVAHTFDGLKFHLASGAKAPFSPRRNVVAEAPTSETFLRDTIPSGMLGFKISRLLWAGLQPGQKRAHWMGL